MIYIDFNERQKFLKQTESNKNIQNDTFRISDF